MKVHELMSELAMCVAGCDVKLFVGDDMYDIDYVTCANHDGACCFVTARPKPAAPDEVMHVTVNKSQLLDAAEKINGGDLSVNTYVDVNGGEHGRD